MDTINDNNTEKAERFIAQVREKIQPHFAKMPLFKLEDLLVVMVGHVVLRELRVAAGREPEPELNEKADAAVYFFKEADLELNLSVGYEE